MLFRELDKVRRHIIMMTILFMFAGILLLELPEKYLAFLGTFCGFLLMVWAMVTALEFVEGPKVLISYILLFLALGAGLVGLAMISFDGFFLWMLRNLVGAVPIVVGLFGCYYALVFARRSGRRGWRVPLVLFGLLILFGILLVWDPFPFDLGTEQFVIGSVLSYSSIVYAILLAWIWPTRAQGRE